MRGYGRVVPGPAGSDRGSRGAAVGRCPLQPLVLLVPVALVVLVLLLVLVLVLVLVHVVRLVLRVLLMVRRWRRRHVVRHRLPAGHRAGPVPGAPRFRERAEGHVRGPGARVRRHARLGPGAALVSDDHRVHGQVRVAGPAPLFVRRRRRGRGRRLQLKRRRRWRQRHRGRRVLAAVRVHAAGRLAVATAHGLRRVAGRGRLGLGLDRVLLEVVGGRHGRGTASRGRRCTVARHHRQPRRLVHTVVRVLLLAHL